MKKGTPWYSEEYVDKKSFFSGNYTAAVVGSIAASVFALIIAVYMTCTQRHAVYTSFRKIADDSFLLYPFIMQTYLIVMFPFNYRHLVKKGKCEHKFSRLVLPLIALALLEVVTVLFVRLLYPF